MMAEYDHFTLLAELADEDSAFASLINGPSFQLVELDSASIDTIVRYISHALTDDESRDVELVLTRSPESRALAREVRHALDRLQAMSITGVSAIAEGNGRDSVVARTWISLVSEAVVASNVQGNRNKIDASLLTSMSGRVHTDSIDVWSMIAAMRESGRRGAQALESALRAISTQVGYAMQRDVVSYARGSAAATLVIQYYEDFDGVPECEVECEIAKCYVDSTGELSCEIQLRAASGQLPAMFDGCMATFNLNSGELKTIIGAAPLKQGRAELTVPSIGDMIGILDAPLPAEYLSVDFVLAVDETASPVSGVDAKAILFASTHPGNRTGDDSVSYFAPVLDDGGFESGAIPVEIVVTHPTVDAGALVLPVVLSAVIRAAYPDVYLSIDVAIAPDQWQRLGAWPVRGFDANTKVLRIPFPGLTQYGRTPREELRFQLCTVPT